MKTLRVRLPPTRNPDVVRLQRLLRNRGLYGGTTDGVYGPVTAQAVYHAKLLLGYQKPDHAAGDVLVAYLEGRRKPTGPMVRRAAARVKAKPGKAGQTSNAPRPSKAQAHETHVRGECAVVMRILLAAEPRVHYRQQRPMRSASVRSTLELKGLLQHGTLALDCSESATLIARLAGAKDPNGERFNATGYTGTILRTCRRVRKTELRVGDLVVFGPGTGNHVCTVLEPGVDPLLFSHGQEKGPLAIRLSVEDRYQAAPTVFLRLPL